MTAEERLQELYEADDWKKGWLWEKDLQGRVYLAPEHIDLIADLVVERLKNEQLQT